MEYITKFLDNVQKIAKGVSPQKIESIVDGLVKVRENNGRLFILGVGGSAGHASHAVNDFRKICGIESYAPTDNVSELTARTNDEGWATVFSEWLKISKLNSKDALLIFSVGGGNAEKNVSENLVHAINMAKDVNAGVYGIVGKDGGHTAKSSDTVVVIPVVDKDKITPHTEGFTAVVWHLLVGHPKLQIKETKWESTK